MANSLCLSCKSCMGDMPYIVRPGKNVYSAETYVGNWYEDTVHNTIRRDDFLRKRECGDLKIQRTQTMIDLLLKPVPLMQQSGRYLTYGDVIQIVCPGPSCSIAVAEHPFKRGHCRAGHLALSASVPPHSIDHAPYLSTDSIISASPLLYPVVRNSFVIENASNPSLAGKTVNYGDVFRIRALPTQHFTLHLFSAPAIRLHHAAIHSGKPKVRFSDVASMDTLWSAWPMDPADEIRMELGVPVPMKARLYIKHNGTGIHLSTEPNFPVLTYFGQELEVTTDTKKDKVRRPYYPNIWYFDADRGRPRPDDELRGFLADSKHDASINVFNVNKDASLDERIKEQERKEAEGEDDDDEDDCTYEIQQQIRNLPLDEKEFKESLRKMDESKDPTAGGQVIYDSRTGPQPNAYAYKVFKNDPYYPNRKWDCGDTDCCNIRPPARAMPQPPGECCDCVVPNEHQPNPNVRDYLLNDLIR